MLRAGQWLPQSHSSNSAVWIRDVVATQAPRWCAAFVHTCPVQLLLTAASLQSGTCPHLLRVSILCKSVTTCLICFCRGSTLVQVRLLQRLPSLTGLDDAFCNAGGPAWVAMAERAQNVAYQLFTARATIDALAAALMQYKSLTSWEVTNHQ